MADHRIHPSIAERVDIWFNLRQNRWRQWRRIACWLGGILPLGLLGWSLLPGNQTVYQSGSVSTVHQGVEDNCRACHTQSFQPLRLLAGSSADKRHIETQACGSCHPETAFDHNELLEQESAADQVVGCLDCHREHQNADQLLAVAADHCVTCHGNTTGIVTQPDLLSFHTSITSFHDHPEFAAVDSERLLEDTARRATQSIDAESGEDPSPFYFSHAKHLNATGVFIPQAHAEYAEENRRKILRCSDCHKADSNGAYMQPISYQQHCASCHPLLFSTKLAQPRNGVGLEPLPHGSEEALHGVIRDRLLTFARQQAKGVETDPQMSRIPNKAASAPSKNEYEFAERELNGIHWRDEEVIQQSMGPIGRRVRQGCQLCHQIEDIDINADKDFYPIQDFPWKIARNVAGGVLPDRWMPHSRFLHDRHNSLGKDALMQLLKGLDINLAIDWKTASAQEIADAHCIVCHQGALGSDSAKSVLMPSVQVCQSCHGSTIKKTGFARADCVECHDYHHGHAQ